MFELIKIEYGRDNMPEPMLLPAEAGTSYEVGMALFLDSNTHTMKVATGDTTATHISLEDKAPGEEEKILCYQILPQMLFEAPLSAYSSTTVAFGNRLQFSEDGKGLSATLATGITAAGSEVKYALGGMIMDTLGANKANDKILVKLH